MYQQNPSPKSIEAMKACPKADIKNLKDLLVEENPYLYVEASEQGRLPILIMSLKQSDCHMSKRPTVVILHSTNMVKEYTRPLLAMAYASRGYMLLLLLIPVIMVNEQIYTEALISSWKNGDIMPFIFDTVWDFIKLANYLTSQRNDIDSARIGITGKSFGGFRRAMQECIRCLLPLLIHNMLSLHLLLELRVCQKRRRLLLFYPLLSDDDED